jgi:hypothetical protein
MSIRFRSNELSAAEASFLKWQYGFDDEDEPFQRSLWQTIMRAWDSDHQPAAKGGSGSGNLMRLGSRDAYPEEVALYVKFKSDHSDTFWDDLIHRAGLTDRRQRKVIPMVDRRRQASAKA